MIGLIIEFRNIHKKQARLTYEVI